jgi:hypothetical protein
VPLGPGLNSMSPAIKTNRWPIDDIAISGFDIPFRKDRNSHGGGIIMYHKSNINILQRVDLEHEHVESMSHYVKLLN